ncbi:MAG: hypothetical protein ACRDP6_07970 [Actinoallomurus sp.]
MVRSYAISTSRVQAGPGQHHAGGVLVSGGDGSARGAGVGTRVPRRWVGQTRPGGVVVCPYSPGFGYGQILRLGVLPGGTAVGRFAGSADFMVLRSHRPAGGPARRWAQTAAGEVTVSETSLDPRAVRHAPISADLVIATLVPGVVSRFYADGDGATLWVLDTDGPVPDVRVRSDTAPALTAGSFHPHS